MIEVNQLRKGSWVYYPNMNFEPDENGIRPNKRKGAICKLEILNDPNQCDNVSIEYDLNDPHKSRGVYPIDAIDPIELKDIDLSDCGFEQKDEYFYMTCTRFISIRVLLNFEVQICITNIKEFEGSNESELNVENMLNIKSLHQLQNLYFALTGEELEINL